MDLVAFHALRSPAGQRLLAEATARGGAEDSELATLTALRREYPAELVAAALTQVRLRQRAAARFGADATTMYFTPTGLEQATRASVATYRAGRFAAAGASRVLDLACGIGADLVQLARAGLTVHGVDRDPLTAAVASANAEVLGLGGSTSVQCADATKVELAGWPAAFVDPDRRADGRRAVDPARHSPPWEFLPALAARVPLTGAKLAPAVPHEVLPADAEAEWISDRGEVTEVALWWGPLGTARRRATLLPSGATLTGSGERAAAVRTPGRWLYEPDGAVVRSHLVAELAERIGAGLFDPTIAYLTTDEQVPTEFARCYEICDVLPFALKRLRALLRARGVGSVTVKKRGSALDPQQLRRDLRLSGDQHATVVLTRVAGRPTALIVRPARAEPGEPGQRTRSKAQACGGRASSSAGGSSAAPPVGSMTTTRGSASPDR